MSTANKWWLSKIQKELHKSIRKKWQMKENLSKGHEQLIPKKEKPSQKAYETS